jgi:protein pelota
LTHFDWFPIEVLSDPLLQSRLADTKAASEVKSLQAFYTMLQNEPSKAFYGIKHVEKANECQAIETLLISDKLFRWGKDFIINKCF